MASMVPRAIRRAGFRILAAVAVAIWALVFLGEGRRVERDPRFCASSCHHAPGPGGGGVAADWHAGGHASQPCQDCHATSLDTGLRLLWASYVGKPPVAHGQVTASACTSCHEKSPAEWRLIADTAGHRQHQEAKGVDCLSCHGASTHADPTPPPAQACVRCHADEKLHKATTAGAETCLSCHGFAASDRNKQPPSPVACEKCHADPRALIASSGGELAGPMRDVNAHSLHGGVACQLCHNAHGIVPKPPTDGQPACVRCHQVEVTQVGGMKGQGPPGHLDCEGCHKPHAPKGEATRTCVGCHEKNALGFTAAGEVTTTALRHASCASCHAPHTWKAQPDGCMTCHKDETARFLARSPPQHKACTDCHDVHGPPPTGAVCLKCHSDTKADHVALAPERHKDCTSCHDPHAPKPEDTRQACATCHQNELAEISRTEGHAKEGCLGCHKPHNDPAPAKDVCAKCHGDKATAVLGASEPRHQECTSCHRAHDFPVTDIVSTCSQCHKNLFDAVARGIDKVPHQADCKTCHSLHGEPRVAQPACLGCHQDVAAAFRPPNAKHATCDSCHASHAPATQAVAACRSCHATEAAVAAAWPPQSAHAQACDQCHRPHEANVEKACSECHAKEAASLASGPAKHQCQQCHAPHQAPPGQGAAWWQRCATCHAEKVAGATAIGGTHGECKNCHQAHDFQIPQCTSCHKDIGAKGLHAVAQHAADCASCHDPHEKALPTREKCLACHVDRRNHEPTAPTCNTCHVFK